MGLRFNIRGQPPTITFLDSGDRRVVIEATTSDRPREVSPPDTLDADRALHVDCTVLEFPELLLGHVRDHDGTISRTIVPDIDARLPASFQRIELHGSMKLFLEFDGPARILTTDDQLRIAFEHSTPVVLAVRSLADGPTTTVTTTAAGSDLLAALSTFGAGLLSTSAERSFPTMRQYPPRLELGTELSIPGSIEPPATGIRIEVPATTQSAFVVAPLAYYLGATLVPATESRIVTDHGFEYPLGTDSTFVEAVARVLKQTFLIDMIVRTEGFFEVPLSEREEIEPVLGSSVAALYDQPIDRRLEAYLTIPYADIADYVPSWPIVADVPSEVARIGLLTHLAYRLAIIRPTAGAHRLAPEEVRTRLLTERFSDAPASRGHSETHDWFQARPTSAIEHVWFGDGLAVGATKGVEVAYERTQETSPDPTIDITVVSNGDVGAAERREIGPIYEETAYLPQSIEIHHDLSVCTLAELLEQPVAFFHYIGHVDEDGFRCRDGHLNVADLDTVGPKAFLLNACDSYEQGISLVEGGSAGGIVTFSEVPDQAAGELGATMARLLHRGFPVKPAHAIARATTITGLQYLVVGDGGVDLAQSRHGPPVLCEAAAADEPQTYDVTMRGYLPTEIGMGILALPYLGEETYAIPPGEFTTMRVSAAELRGYLDRFDGPVMFDGRLCWSSDDLPA